MADLLFKRGLYSDLHKVAITDGAVYFTTDTHELYFDAGTQRHRIQDVLSYNTLSEVIAGYPSADDKAGITGRLIYVSDRNILMTWNGTEWTQVNAQQTLANLMGTPSVSLAGEGNALVGITQTFGTGTDKVSTSFNIATTTPDMVSLTASGDNVIVDVTDYRENAEMTVAAATDGATLSLTVERETLDADGAVTATEEVASSDVTIVGEGNYTDVKVANGKVVVSTDLDVALAPNADGQLSLGLYANDKTTLVKEQNVTLKATLHDDSEVLFAKTSENELTLDLDVYSTAEVDAFHQTIEGKITTATTNLTEQIRQGLNAADAMTFKGTVGVSGSQNNPTKIGLPLDGVKIGDTYKVADTGVYTLSSVSTDVFSAVAGDMFVATSMNNKEDVQADKDNYVIAREQVKWVYIPSGNDSMYELWADDGMAFLGAHDEDSSRGKIVEGTAIEIVANSSKEAVINHANVEHGTSKGAAVTEAGLTKTTFTAVTGVTVNEQGHVTNVQTTEFNTLGYVPKASQELAVSNNSAAIQATTLYNDGNEVTNITFAIDTDDLVITQNGDSGIKINHPVYNPTKANKVNVSTLADLTVVTDVEYDNLGHLKAVKTGGLNAEALVPDSLNAKIVAAADNKSAVLTITEAYGAASVDTELALESSTLSLTQTADSNIAINLVWGSF